MAANDPYQYYNTSAPPRQPTTSATPTVAKWPTSSPVYTNNAGAVASSPWRSAARQPTTNTAEKPPAVSPYGTESGPGILENWFGQRATGTDPAFEYAMGRGNQALDNQYASAGAYNSGAAARGKSDLYANLTSQREGQLDALAAGASGEHQNRLNSMFNQANGLASGQAGTMGAYDLASANTNNAFMNALVQMMGGKAGVDAKANQGLINNLLAGGALYAAM